MLKKMCAKPACRNEEVTSCQGAKRDSRPPGGQSAKSPSATAPDISARKTTTLATSSACVTGGRALPLLQRVEHAVGIVADDALDAGVDHARDVRGLVHRPDDDADPQLLRRGDLLRRELAEVGRPDSAAGGAHLLRVGVLGLGEVHRADLRRLALDYLQRAEVEGL